MPRGKVPVVCVDFSKAFDCVDHDLLIHKLITEFRLSQKIISILKNYLNNRIIKIKVNGTISNSFSVESGVPKGSILGPILFTLFINELDSILLTDDVSFLLYADDLAIYTYNDNVHAAMDRLQNVLTKLDNWSTSVGLFMNYSKTKYMIFHKSQDTTHIPNLILKCNNMDIERVHEFKYLGISLDPSLTFMKYLSKVESKVALAVGRVDRLKRQLTTKTFLQLLNSYILSNIDFCVSVWAVHTPSHFISCQNRINKLIRSFFHPKTAKCKFQRLIINSKYKDIINAYTKDITELWELCNMHSINERINYYLLIEVHRTLFKMNNPAFKEWHIPIMKDWFKIKVKSRSDRYENMLEIVTHSTQTYKKSFRSRAIDLWNKMIMAGDVFSLTFADFKKNVALWVMKGRDSVFFQ